MAKEEYAIHIPIQQYHPNELTDTERIWVDEAIAAAKKAYAPYSRFQVGAAVVLADGQIVTGSNQENAAYPSGLCAERVALFYAGARYPDIPVKAIVIVACRDGIIQKPTAPCGACRQVMLETERRYRHQIQIILYGSHTVYEIASVESLLPLAFDADLRSNEQFFAINN